MDHFYCPPGKIAGNAILIDGEEFNHLVHVMRKKSGDEIRVVDGKGTAYDVILGEMKKHTASGSVTVRYERYNEPAIDVTLAVAVLKNPSKFDFLVEKVTELGVKQIVPILTERTIPSHAKVDRWQKLALAAMKQCGRAFLPVVSKLMTLDEYISGFPPSEVQLIAHEQASDAPPLGSYLKKHDVSASLLVGPEGGFSEEEVERSVLKGWRPLYLGPRRLRTETAAVVATYAVMRG
jgi:16S rRNA (uracil1498-N3)-methyltransferase